MTTLRRIGDAELEILAPLFAATFGVPISRDELRWKYADGHGESWTVWQGGELVMHCGACRRDVLIAGQAARAHQLVDLMAPPKSRGLSRAGSPFALLMRALLQPPEAATRLAFGLPSARAMRLGMHLGVYRSAGQVAELVFAARACRARTEPLAHMAVAMRKRIDALWEHMAADFSAATIGVRDAAYIERRYLARPGKSYLPLLVKSRWLGRPAGLAVLRPDFPHAELLDVVAPRARLPEIFSAVRGWLAETGRSACSFLLSEPHAATLGPLADERRKTEFHIMANPFLPAEVLRLMENRWWLTGGDTDYR